MNLRLPLATLLLALPLLSAVAFGQDADADRATARSLAAEGLEALNARDYARAADRFGRADSIIHVPSLALGLARAQVGLGKLVAAQETYRRILREGVAPGAPAPFIAAVDDARKDLAALTPRIAWVTVDVQGAGATVLVDGTPIPAAALGVRRAIDPGKHVVSASAPGLASQDATIELGEGKAGSVSLQLKPPQASPPPVAPPATPLGKPPSPAPAPALAPVAHAPPPDAAPADEPKGQSRGSSRRTLGVVGLGVGAAGLGLGIVAGIVAVGDHGTLVKDCPSGACPDGAASTLSGYHTMGLVSTVGFIVAGVGFAGGAALLLTAPRDRAPARAFVSPYVGPASLGAMGRF